MPTGRKNHIHKYYKLPPHGLWYCALPNCTHFMPHNVAYQVEGKYSLCWNCGAQFKLSAQSMENDRPECPTCMLGMPEVTGQNDVVHMIKCMFCGEMSEDIICPRCMKEKLSEHARNPTQSSSSKIVDEPESEYVAPTDTPVTTVETEKPRRTPEQQKAYDKIMRELGLR